MYIEFYKVLTFILYTTNTVYMTIIRVKSQCLEVVCSKNIKTWRFVEHVMGVQYTCTVLMEAVCVTCKSIRNGQWDICVKDNGLKIQCRVLFNVCFAKNLSQTNFLKIYVKLNELSR